MTPNNIQEIVGVNGAYSPNFKLIGSKLSHVARNKQIKLKYYFVSIETHWVPQQPKLFFPLFQVEGCTKWIAREPPTKLFLVLERIFSFTPRIWHCIQQNIYALLYATNIFLFIHVLVDYSGGRISWMALDMCSGRQFGRGGARPWFVTACFRCMFAVKSRHGVHALLPPVSPVRGNRGVPPLGTWRHTGVSQGSHSWHHLQKKNNTKILLVTNNKEKQGSCCFVDSEATKQQVDKTDNVLRMCSRVDFLHDS